MTNKIDFRNHQILQDAAKSEGITYRDYRRKLDRYNVATKEAFEFLREGKNLEQYLQERSKSERNLKQVGNGIIASMVLGLSLSIASIFYGMSCPETDIGKWINSSRLETKADIQIF